MERIRLSTKQRRTIKVVEMKLAELLETKIQLNELKEYLDLNHYGSWIHPDGTVEEVDNHENWLKERFGDAEAYDKAFEEGFIRIVHPPSFLNGILNVMGKFNNIKKTFKYWWPTVLHSISVIIEDENWENVHIYDIPKDKNKLLKDFGPKR